MLRWILPSLAGLLMPGLAFAHPIPRSQHDRTITVRLTRTAVVVEYVLEVDEFTVNHEDLPAVLSKAELQKLTRPSERYDAFGRLYAPILANNLDASLDKKLLVFTCTKRSFEVTDSLKCQFLFEAAWQIDDEADHAFRFREANYVLEAGHIKLSLTDDGGFDFVEKIEPSEELKNRRLIDLRPGDEDKLRNASATIRLAKAPTPAPAPSDKSASWLGSWWDAIVNHTSLTFLLESDKGFWLLLLLACLFGAVHALTPGHGKTLVAAYLVGQRGTVLHALLLGLITTLTHTGVVLVLAAVLFFFPYAPANVIEKALGVGAGLLVAGMGFWLLVRRLTGQVDHVHIGGHGHHHHRHDPAHPHDHGHDHSHADHYHDEDGHAHPVVPAIERAGWWGMIILGIQGGIIPCWDAIALFAVAVSLGKFWLGLPLVLAFSAGLAGVLVAIGIAVVQVKRFATSRWGDNLRILPFVSALLITAIGLWLCFQHVVW